MAVGASIKAALDAEYGESGWGGGGGGASWGGITGTLSSQTDLNTALSGKAAASQFLTYVKAGDTSRANTAAHAADPDLVSATLEASSIYRFELLLLFTGGTAEDMRFRIGRTGLSDADLRFASDLDNASAPTLTWAGNVNCAVAAAGTLYMGNYIGVLRTGTDTGTVAVEWAQQVSGATAAVMKAGSLMLLRKVL